METWKSDDNAYKISFSGQSQSYCVCFVSMMDSVESIFAIKNPEKISRYYSIFFNTIAAIARNFGAKVIKNTGTSVIYYFPKTSDFANMRAFQDTIECGITIIEANKVINAKLKEEKLPSMHYKLSADYGSIEVARSRSSTDMEDLFGSTMNICSKINSLAPLDGMVIGSDLYYVVKKCLHSSDQYYFKSIGEYSITPNLKHRYPVYSVVGKKRAGATNSILDLEKQIPKLETSSQLQNASSSTSTKPPRQMDEKLKPHSDYADIQSKSGERQPLQQQKDKSSSAAILIVDDEPDMLLTYKTFLENDSYSVHAYTDPTEALQKFAQADPNFYNLVLMDIRMPNLNGIQLYYRLKSINPDIKILFLSALDAAEEMVSILPGVKLEDVIRKPVDQKQFLYKIKAALVHW